MDSLIFEFTMIHNFHTTDGQASLFIKSKLFTGNSSTQGKVNICKVIGSWS